MTQASLVDAHRPFPAGPASLFAGGWRARRLIGQLIKREVLGRYRGSVMGVAWSFLHPILMLAVYTFVFSVVFEAKWPGMLENQGKSRFVLLLFSGVIAHGLIAEVLTKKHSAAAQKAGVARAAISDSHSRNADVIRAMGFSSRAIARFEKINAEHLALQTKTNDVAGTLGGISKVLRMILQSFVLRLCR